MIDLQPVGPIGIIPRLGRVFCLCLLLIVPGFANAQNERVAPDGPPVPVAEASDRVGGQAQAPNAPDLENSLRDLYSRGGGGSNLALMIPILAVSLIFGGPLALVIVLAILHYRSKRYKEQMRAENIQRALESGREIPPELLRENGAESTSDNRNKGIRNLGLGLGLVVALTLMLGIEFGAVGFILVGIGGSQLVLWRLDQKKPTDAA